MPTIHSQLSALIGSGATLVLTYNGGSRPGQERAVIPVALTPEELTAREVGQRSAKSYKLAKIAKVRTLEGETLTNTAALPVIVSALPEFESLQEYIPYFKQRADSAGWHAEATENSFAIHGYFKNGKHRKGSVASIRFVDRSANVVVDVFTGEVVEEEVEITGRERPWRVDSKRMGDGKSFALLHRAASLFLEELALASNLNDA
jgi:hypothetical protein